MTSGGSAIQDRPWLHSESEASLSCMKPCLKKKIRLTLNLFPCHLCNRVVPHCPEGPSPCLSMAPVNILPHRVHETKHKNPSSQVGEKHKYIRALPIMSKRRSRIPPSRQQTCSSSLARLKTLLRQDDFFFSVESTGSRQVD